MCAPPPPSRSRRRIFHFLSLFWIPRFKMTEIQGHIRKNSTCTFPKFWKGWRGHPPCVELALFCVSGCFCDFQNSKGPKYTVIWAKIQHAFFRNFGSDWLKGAAAKRRAFASCVSGCFLNFKIQNDWNTWSFQQKSTSIPKICPIPPHFEISNGFPLGPGSLTATPWG